MTWHVLLIIEYMIEYREQRESKAYPYALNSNFLTLSGLAETAVMSLNGEIASLNCPKPSLDREMQGLKRPMASLSCEMTCLSCEMLCLSCEMLSQNDAMASRNDAMAPFGLSSRFNTAPVIYTSQNPKNA
ncbi:MAG: hypothetical protein JNJ58_07440 [Chitinophagaceae bacterium]|nr:hypothetical protein [Chitinophagaceae bacterium]